MEDLSADELKAKTAEFRKRVSNGESLDDTLMRSRMEAVIYAVRGNLLGSERESGSGG